MSYDIVRRWKNNFESGVESIKNAPKSGRPKFASPNEIVSKRKEIIEGDAKFTVIARKVGISLSTVHLILKKHLKYVLKRVSFGSRECTIELKLECAYFLGQTSSFCHLGFISDPLIISKFHNETHDPKGQENKIYTIVKGRETFYRRHTVPVTSCSKVKYVLKRVSFGSKECTIELKLECAYFLGQTI